MQDSVSIIDRADPNFKLTKNYFNEDKMCWDTK